MKNVNIERALEIIENEEYSKVETASLLGKGLVLDININNNEQIRLLHVKKTIVNKEHILIHLKRDGKVYEAIKIKENDEKWNDILKVFKNTINNNFKEDYSKFF